MNELVFIQNEQPITTSLKVAEVFEKNHKDVLEKIRFLSAEISANPKIADYDPQFTEKIYSDIQGRPQPFYEMNRDGFTELVGNMNGVKVREWKRKYFAAFNKMENALIEILAERKSAEYLEVRNATKVGYKKLAETIHQVLVPLAREQGSDTEEKFFHINYARSINKRLGIKSKSRDKLPVGKLYEIEKMQSMADVSIKGLAAKGEDFHKIYRSTDQTLENYAQISLISQRFLN